MALNLSFGFDCDVPRGIAYSSSVEGKRVLKLTINGLKIIADTFNNGQIARSFFICGEFLDTLLYFMDREDIRKMFSCPSRLVEIGNHSWSHSIVKAIHLRPDKKPLDIDELRAELGKTNKLIDKILSPEAIIGFRPPLGHYKGLTGDDEILSTIKEAEFKYISSDIRSHGGGINPPLIDEQGKLRQPYFYSNGLLEIPAHGWHDTAFGGKSKTPMFESPPLTPTAIQKYFINLIDEASYLADSGSDFFLNVVMHPNEVAAYADSKLFTLIFNKVKEVGGSFSTCREIHAFSKDYQKI